MATNQKKLLAHIAGHSRDDFFRFLYWQQIAEAHMAIAGLESAIVNAMTMCDEIKIQDKLGPEDSKAFSWIAKRKHLENSTLGGLITIMERHGFKSDSINYLRWVKSQRNYFVHKHFFKTPWPGDLDYEDCYIMIRRLKYIEIVLDRAASRVWKIFESEGLIVAEDLGGSGKLIYPSNYFSDN